MHVKRIDDAEGQFVWLKLSGEASVFFNRNYRAGRLKLVQEEYKKLVKELTHRGCVSLSLFRKVVILDHVGVRLKECVRLKHAKHLGIVAVFSIAAVFKTASTLF